MTCRPRLCSRRKKRTEGTWLKIVVLALVEGRARERFATEGVADYLSRASHHVPVELRELRREAELLRALPAGYRKVYLDPAGKELTSEEFARFVEREMVAGTPGIAFVLGGPTGLPASLPAPDLKLSLSRLTMAHRLARLVLAEQIYRALTIIRGEPYHK